MLTQDEQNELALLEEEEKQSNLINQNSLGLKPVKNIIGASNLSKKEQEELDFLLQEEDQAQKYINEQMNPSLELPEAELGASTAFKYAIEPFESNRRALLVEKFGKENVMQDERGNVFIKQGDYFRPVNKPGFSTRDVLDVAGATPEMIGGVAGLGVGPVGAAIGGAIGSTARQGLSAILGTPQVAGLGERAGEIALSSAFGAAGAAIGKGLKGVSKKITNLLPENKIDEAFQAVAKKVKVEPTMGQLSGGRSLEIEKILQETPIFGRKIRNQVNNQVKQLKGNLSNAFGDFTDLDFDKTTIGAELKNRASENINLIKDQASNLFDELSSRGVNIKTNANSLVNSLSKNFEDLKIINSNGRPLKYNAFSGLTKDQFNRVQGVTLDIIDAIKNTAKKAGGAINANEINTLRKTIDAEIKEAGKMGLDDVALLKMREAFLNVTEEMLSQEEKINGLKLIGKEDGLKQKFKEARSLYKNYLDKKKVLEKEFKIIGSKSITDEKVLDRIFRDTSSLEKFSNIVDEKTLKLAGDNFIKNLLSKKIGRDGQLATKTAINTIYEKNNQIKKAIGNDAFNILINNLKYLDRIGEPINPSKTAITELKTNLIKGAGLRLEQLARNKVVPKISKSLQSTKNIKKYSPLISEPISRDITFSEIFSGKQIPMKDSNE